MEEIIKKNVAFCWHNSAVLKTYLPILYTTTLFYFGPDQTEKIYRQNFVSWKKFISPFTTTQIEEI